ncbi:hypothetical protein K1719_031401 [Acacia pycnantha]|nr:hypothetical protein K1719_031401 [Acacia pycnantha]
MFYDPLSYTKTLMLRCVSSTGLVSICFCGATTKGFLDDKSAERVFEVMEDGKIQPDIACYSEGNFDSCLRLYQELEERGLEIPPHAYSLVICGLCREGKHLEGYTVFETMFQRGHKANKAIYTALIDSYAKSGNMEGAMKLFERMNLDEIKPDEVTFGAIVNGLCKCGRLEEAMDYFKYCNVNGITVNAVLYSSLIDGLGKAGRVDEAEKLFEEMAKKGCSRDSYCYNALIDAMSKCGRMDEALELFRRMEDEGITPNVASFRALSIGLCLSGKVARASCKLADGVVDRGREIPGRIRTVLINALRKAGNADLAIKLMHSKIGIGYDRMGSVKKRVEFQNLVDR